MSVDSATLAHYDPCAPSFFQEYKLCASLFFAWRGAGEESLGIPLQSLRSDVSRQPDVSCPRFSSSMEWGSQPGDNSALCVRPHQSASASRVLLSYEISDDLQRRHVQALERKYGGRLRSHTAATKIQRAFRLYRLHKQFQSVVARESQHSALNSQRDNEALNRSGDAVPKSTVKYQPVNSLRAQLLAERSSPSPRKTSTPSAIAYAGPSHRQGSTSARGFVELMSPRLSQRHPFDTSCPAAGGTFPSVWVQQPRRETSFRTPSPPSAAASRATVAAPFSLSDGHRHDTHSLPRMECCRQYQSSRDCRPGMPTNGTPTNFCMQSTPSCSMNCTPNTSTVQHATTRETDQHRRRLYRIALNFFNKKPDRGIKLLLDWGFVDEDPRAIAKFFLSRRGLGKQMVGEFLGTLRSNFHASVLENVLAEISMQDVEVDVALREMLYHFRLPSEAQKIDYVMQAFAKRYIQCNSARLASDVTLDAIYVLAFATIMLNTDLHSPSMKENKKMSPDEFVKNTWGAEDSKLFDRESLMGIYKRVKECEIRSGSDHITQVLKVDQSIIGKDKPQLVEQHRRLICYCRLNQVHDQNKKQPPNAHLREVFLFNDVILVTKNVTKKKSTTQYLLRLWSPLIGAKIDVFDSQNYPFGVIITLQGHPDMYFNAKNGDDRSKFVADVRESVAESTEMEKLRLKFELDKQQREVESRHSSSTLHRTDSQRDSGLPDIDPAKGSGVNSSSSSTESSTPSVPQAGCYSSFSSGSGSAPTQRLSELVQGRRLSFNSLDSGVVEEITELL